MASHDELVAEMPVLEQMGTQERQKLAKKRRMQQLKKWSQREKDWLVKEKQLNKRLASILNEENNGLNLKQYTTYNSNQRTKKKTAANNRYSASNTNGEGEEAPNKQQQQQQHEQKFLNNNNSTSNFNHKNNAINNNNNNGKERAYANSLTPNGRVHFNVGVMLLEAAARNDYDEVKRLLSLGVSPDSVNHDGLTALHQCCIDASEPMMSLLLEYGASVDARDTEQWTPLHAACTCGHLNLVKILVEHGADLLAVNGDGNMPFDICEDEATLDYIESQMVARGITQEMIDLTRASNEMQLLADLEAMVAKKCDPNVADASGVTPLHIAAANNYLSAVKFLIQHGVNVNVCDNDQWRPLHGVACWGNEQHIKIVELLVESGASLDAKTSNDETVFDLCDNIDLLERLNQLKSELESKQATGTGRLKRTQSKTNSRVHSVRRTSVRDKNQISRREAREEAMLRVESNESLANGESKRTETSSSSETASSSAESSPAKNETTLDQRQAGDQVDGCGPLETDLDGDARQALEHPAQNGNDQKSAVPNGTADQSALTNGNVELRTSTRSQEGEEERDEATKQDDNEKAASNQAKTATNTDNHTANQRVETAPAHETGRMRIQSAPQLMNGTAAAAAPSSLPTRPIPDLNGRLPAQSTTIVQVHFAPMNYTLSNLKKHRSDLRMRSASSGNTTLVQLGGQQPDHSTEISSISTLPDVGAESGRALSSTRLATNGGGLAEAEMNTATFRKFHGEPSGVIEFTETRRHHRCCTII